MKHLIVAQNHQGVTVKCGATVKRDETTIWNSEVDCPRCTPYDWEREQEVPTKVWKRKTLRRA